MASLEGQGIPSTRAPRQHAKSLTEAIDSYKSELNALKTRSSVRNLLFWCFDLLPVPVLFVINLYLLIAE